MTSSEEGTDERVGADHSTASFTALANLASARLGGRALEASDEFFASKSNLLKPTQAIFIPDKFTSRGKWMDGWESRRRRTPGHDWCLIALGLRGVVHGVNVDTRFFTGNYPSHCSIDAMDAERSAKQGKGSQAIPCSVDHTPRPRRSCAVIRTISSPSPIGGRGRTSGLTSSRTVASPDFAPTARPPSTGLASPGPDERSTSLRS